MIDGVILSDLVVNEDKRGWLSELFRSDETVVAQMAYVSVTYPGITRGPHEHLFQTDMFFFIQGAFDVWLWDNRQESKTYGERIILTLGWPGREKLIVPPGVVHAYKNTTSREGLIINAPDRLYKGANKAYPVDEIRHEDGQGDSRYAEEMSNYYKLQWAELVKKYSNRVGV